MNLSDISSFGVDPLFENALLANLKDAFEFSIGNTNRVKRSRYKQSTAHKWWTKWLFINQGFLLFIYFPTSRSSVPMILMPRQSDKECIPSNQASGLKLWNKYPIVFDSFPPLDLLVWSCLWSMLLWISLITPTVTIMIGKGGKKLRTFHHFYDYTA